MPAINFKARFVQPIRAGLKTHTIRARVPTGFSLGAYMPLYSGQRTRSCVLIGSGRADRVDEVRLDFDERIVERRAGGGAIQEAELNAFAVSDGFEDWSDMEAFWAVNHPGVRYFTGTMIGWADFVQEHRLG